VSVQAGWAVGPGAGLASLAPDGRSLAVLGPSRDADRAPVAVHDAATGAAQAAFTVDVGRPLRMWLGPEGTSLAVCQVVDRFQSSALFDRRTGRRCGAVPGPVWGFAFARDGSGLASWAWEGPVGWHDASDGRRLGDFEASAGYGGEMLTTDGRRLAAVSEERPTLSVWDVATRRSTATMGLSGWLLAPPAFDADGRLFCLAEGGLLDEGGNVLGPAGWPPSERATTFSIAGHGAFLARGPLTLRVWRPDGASPPLEGDAEGLLACGWLPDGRLLTCGRDGVNLWPAALFRA
jgi:hypothetical protein